MTSAPFKRTGPAPLTAGVYFFVVKADDPDAILEASEDNNVGASLTRLIVGTDLKVASATAAPAGVAPGMNVSISYTLRNGGGSPTPGAFDVAAALVPVTAPGAPAEPDIPLGMLRSITGLDAGTMVSAKDQATIPGGIAAGLYRVRVTVDSGLAVPEADEANNTLLTGTVKVVRPDLTVPVLRLTPAAIGSGMNVSIAHVIRNIAPAPGHAPPSDSVASLSLNQSVDGVVAPLATFSVPALKAGVSSPTLVRSVAPGNLSPGRYFVIVGADDAGTIVEAREDNNLASAVLLVGPDVTVTAASTAAGAIPGRNVSVSHTLRNPGGVSAGPFDVGFVLVPVNPAGPDIPLAVVRPDVVLPARVTAAAVKTPVPIPPDVADGQYRIRVIADAADVVVEADESNNSLTTGLLTIRAPDLSIRTLAVPSVAVAGRSFPVATTVRNNAAAPGTAPAFQVGLYVSPDDVIDPATDTLLASRTVTSLTPGASSSATTSLTLTTTGDYFIGAVADRAGVVVEANESNNIEARPIAVVPAMVRTTSARLDTTLSGCLIPDLNRSFTDFGTLVISKQTGPDFAGVLRISGGGVVLSFPAKGTVDTAGGTTGTFTFSISVDGTVFFRGDGAFVGTATSAIGGPGTFTATLTGQFTQGDVCAIAPSNPALFGAPRSPLWRTLPR